VRAGRTGDDGPHHRILTSQADTSRELPDLTCQRNPLHESVSHRGQKGKAQHVQQFAPRLTPDCSLGMRPGDHSLGPRAPSQTVVCVPRVSHSDARIGLVLSRIWSRVAQQEAPS
jgi:hypothetical protein